MFLFSLLTRRHGRRRQPQPYRFRPRLEVLEGRALPSTLVVQNTDDHGPGSLRDTIAAAASGDTIVFADSLQGQTITLSGELALSKSLDIHGPADNPVVINGNKAGLVFDIILRPVTVTLFGLTVTNGKSNVGGGIFNFGTLTISHSTLSGNSAILFGGGIFNFGTLTVSASTLSGNSATADGGGIFNDGMLTVDASTLSGNSAATDGGAIYNLGTLMVSASTLSGNSAGGFGGGIFNGGWLTVSASTLSGNFAQGGGGIYNLVTLSVLDHSTICGNTATAGADLCNLSSYTKDDSSTICVILSI